MPVLPRISDAEWEVMKVLWAKSPLTANEIIATLQRSDPTWHPITVRTLINRLLNKKALGFDKAGRAYRYRPLVGEKACTASASDSFLRRVFGGSLWPMLAHYAERGKLSARDIRELKRLLEEPDE